MKVLAILFIVLVSVYAIVSIVTFINAVIERKKKLAAQTAELDKIIADVEQSESKEPDTTTQSESSGE